VISRKTTAGIEYAKSYSACQKPEPQPHEKEMQDCSQIVRTTPHKQPCDQQECHIDIAQRGTPYPMATAKTHGTIQYKGDGEQRRRQKAYSNQTRHLRCGIRAPHQRTS